MKRNSTLISSSLFLLLFIASSSFSQTDFTKYESNPVLIRSNNFYEETAIGSPSVILLNDTLRMFYATGGTDLKGRINYAYSLDGKSWTKYNNAQPVLDIGAPGSWDDYFLDTPEIIQDSEGYKLYYFGDRDNYSTGSALGVATSTDLVNWERVGENPILSPGNPGDWDGLFIESPSVTISDGIYYMLYSGVDTTWQVKIGLATSSDGIIWTKYAGNPVLNGGVNTSWEGFSIATPSILKTNNGFEMWYCGVSFYDILDNNQVDTIKLGYATSTDAMNWVKHAGNPILNTYSAPFTQFETRGPWTPDVIYWADSSKYYMWYETAYGFGLATSTSATAGFETISNAPTTVRIYPNPTSHTITISGGETGELVRIYNSIGQLMKEQSLSASFQIDVSDFPQGIYIAQLKNKNLTQKIIKQ